MVLSGTQLGDAMQNSDGAAVAESASRRCRLYVHHARDRALFTRICRR